MPISSALKKEMYEYLIRVAKQPKKATLSDVALETLSIIAATSSRSQERRSRRSEG